MLNSASKHLQRYCTLQSSLGPLEQRKIRRRHGLQLPLHPQQITGWLVLIIITIFTYTTVLPELSSKLKIILTTILSAILVIHTISHVAALIIDPSEVQVRSQPINSIVPEFDRTKHLHVIENDKCHLCNIIIGSKRTKHCSFCNKCIENFDHHCLWLNNCIGSRNYNFFIICIISAIIGTLILFTISTVQIIVTIEKNYFNNTMENMTIPIATVQPIQNTSTLIIISIVGILSAIAAALLVHLCVFHGYIAYLGLTTYEYLRNKREQKALLLQQQQQQESKVTSNLQGTSANHSNYHFCKDINSLETPVINKDSSQVFICSTHTTQMTTSKAGVNREKRNFHLYFTYETPDDATSFELSSQTNGEQQVHDLSEIVKPAELKPLTPSPVSCCFSIINHSWTDRKKKKEDKVVGKCTPVRRIQTFLRSRLRKNSRQRAGLDTARGRKNRIGPLGTDETIKTDDKDNLETITGSIHEDVATRAPIKLPPLNLPSREEIQDIIPEKTILSLPVVKRNQQLRVRRQSFNRRPRFKMGPHVTQSAQLSPIPESELSKPASPRTPPKLKHFPFPPTSSD